MVNQVDDINRYHLFVKPVVCDLFHWPALLICVDHLPGREATTTESWSQKTLGIIIVWDAWEGVPPLAKPRKEMTDVNGSSGRVLSSDQQTEGLRTFLGKPSSWSHQPFEVPT